MTGEQINPATFTPDHPERNPEDELMDEPGLDRDGRQPRTEPDARPDADSWAKPHHEDPYPDGSSSGTSQE